MKRLLSLLTALGFTATAAIPVVACGSSSKTADKSNAKDLGDVVLETPSQPIAVPTNKHLSDEQVSLINDNVNAHVANELQDKIIADGGNTHDDNAIDYSKEFTTNFVDLVKANSNVVESRMTITITSTPESTLLDGSTKMDLFFANDVTLQQAVTNTNLGNFATTPTEAEVMAKVSELNPAAILTNQVTVTINDPGEGKTGTAVLTATEASLYQGTVELQYSIGSELSDVITVTNIEDKFPSQPNAEQIIAAVIAANPNANLTADDLAVSNISDTSATIIPGSSGKYKGEVQITFGVKTQLTEALKVLALGEFAEMPDANAILNKVVEVNSDSSVKTSDLTVEDGSITTTGANIIASADSDFVGSVSVTYTVAKKDLSTVIKNTDLGKIVNPDAASITAAIIKQYPSIKAEDINITEIKVEEGTATVTANENSLFSGSVQVTFENDSRQALSDIIKNTVLGAITDNKPQTILDAINSTNGDLGIALSDVSIQVNETNNGATVTANSESEKYAGEVAVSFSFANNITIDNASPSVLMGAKATIKVTNYEGLEGLKLNNSNDEIATITAGENGDYNISPVAVGNTTVTFTANNGNTAQATISVKQNDLSESIAITDLGVIANTDVQTILDAVNTKNSSNGLNLTTNQVDIKVNDNNDGATISAKSGAPGFVGQASLTFTVAQSKQALSDIVKVTNLGEISNTENDTIIQAINNANEGLSLDGSQVTIQLNGDTGATITANDNSTSYTGSVTVSFTVAATKKSLTEVIGVTNLGSIENNQLSTIIQAINDKNPEASLQENQYTLSNESESGATITATDESPYSGSVDVTFNIATEKKSLSDLVKNTDLGIIENISPETNITNAITEKNPGVILDPDQLVITVNDDVTGATITPQSNSTDYVGSVEVTFSFQNTISVDNETLNIKVGEQQQIKITNFGSLNHPGMNVGDNTLVDAKAGSGGVINVTGLKAGSTSITFNAWNANPVTVSINITQNNLSEIVTTKELGQIDNTDSSTIINAVNAVNEDLNLDESQVNVSVDEGNTSATITAKEDSTSYTGTVNVTFTVKASPSEKTDLKDGVAKTALGEIANVDPATIIEAINQANEGLNLDASQVDVVVNEDQTGATVTAKEDSASYTGTVDVTFTVKASPSEKTSLRKLINKTVLGLITDTKDETILKAINTKNPGINLDASQVSIAINQEKTGATITPASNETIYSDWAYVSFSINE